MVFLSPKSPLVCSTFGGLTFLSVRTPSTPHATPLLLRLYQSLDVERSDDRKYVCVRRLLLFKLTLGPGGVVLDPEYLGSGEPLRVLNPDLVEDKEIPKIHTLFRTKLSFITLFRKKDMYTVYHRLARNCIPVLRWLQFAPKSRF